MIGAVVLPEAPAIGAGTIGLFLILSFLFLLALQQSWRVTIGWLFHIVADLLDAVSITVFHHTIAPFGGVAHRIRAASDNVYAALGRAALKTEHAGVWFFHEAWRMIRWTGDEIAALSTDTYHAVAHVIEHDIPHGIEVGVRPLRQALRGIDQVLGRLTDLVYDELARAAVGIDRLARIAIHSIPAVVDDLIGAVEGVVGKLERTAIRTSRLEKALGAAAFAAAVATALNRLGLRWLRCPALGRIGRKVGCGGFAFAEMLLAETLDVLLIRDLCRMVGAIEQLAVAFEGELLALVDEIEGFICGGEAVVPSGIVRADLKRVAKRPTGLTAYDLKPPVARKIAA